MTTKKPHLVVAQFDSPAGPQAAVGKMSVRTEGHLAEIRKLPDGKFRFMVTEYLCFDRNPPVRFKILRRTRVATLERATATRDRWKAEAEQARKELLRTLAAQPKKPEPRGPENAEPISKPTKAAARRAIHAALSRWWPRSISIILGYERDAARLRDAYTLDIAERTGQSGAVDPIHVAALVRAVRRYHRRPRKPLFAEIGLAIALHWVRGWCFLTRGEIVDKIFKMTGKKLSREAVRKIIERLKLPKHRPRGPSPRPL